MDTTFTPQTSPRTQRVADDRPTTSRSADCQSPEVTQFRQRASRRHGRISLAFAVLGMPAVSAALLGSHVLQGDGLRTSAVAVCAVATVAVIALFAFLARRGMTPPKYAYLGALDAPEREQAKRDLREGTPSSDPVMRLAETQRAEWADESGHHVFWVAPLLVAIVVLAGWANWSDWAWLSNLPMWTVFGHSAWRLGTAARERAAAQRYLDAVKHERA